jgi:hypothetical protein
MAKAGASSEPSFAEATRFLEQAGNSLGAREFTSAAQRFVQAKDAFDSSVRAVELKEREAAREAARNAQPTPTATPRPAPSPTAVAAIPSPTTQVLTPVLVPTPPPVFATPQPTPQPTVAVRETPPPVATPEATPPPVFTTGRTNVRSVGGGTGRAAPRGFDLGGASVQDFQGDFEFEVAPNPPPAGGAFTLRIFLRNKGQRPAKVETLTGAVSGGAAAPLRIMEDDVRPGQRVQIAEYRGTWPERGPWSIELVALSNKQESYRATFSAR